METLHPFVVENAQALFDIAVMVIAFLVCTVIIGSCEMKKMTQKIKEQKELIDEMDKFIENNSRVWQ